MVGVDGGGGEGEIRGSPSLRCLWVDLGCASFFLLCVCVLCLYCARAIGPLSHSVMVDSSCHAGC